MTFNPFSILSGSFAKFLLFGALVLSSAPMVWGQNNPAPFIGTNLARGTELLELRLAVSCTGEYVQQVGSVDSARNYINQWIDELNEVYGREYCVRFKLIPNNDLLIFPDPATDPWPDLLPGTACVASPDVLNAQPQVVDNIIGAANYDISHVFYSDVLGGGCAGSFKTGVSGPPDLPITRHEIGHQFGQAHTISNGGNNNYELEGGNWSIHGGNAQPYAHSKTYHELANNLLTTNAGKGTAYPTGNTIPTVDAGPDVYIPVNTPYEMKVVGSDPDPGDQLTYAWDQLDGGPSWGSPVTHDTLGPLFMRFIPTPNPSRTIPRITDVIAGNLKTATENLASKPREMNVRVTVNDSHRFNFNGELVNASGINSDDVKITVVDLGGAFTVTAPNAGAEVWTTTNNVTVSWSVAGANNAPVNCDKVDIRLSLDGGLTYPITLLDGTPNDGTETFQLPAGVPATTQARIRVEADHVQNIRFFDISDNDFTINSACNLVEHVVIPSTAVVAAPGAPALALDLNPVYSAPLTSVTLSVDANDPTGKLAEFDGNNNNVCKEGSALRYKTYQVKVSKTGKYTLLPKFVGGLYNGFFQLYAGNYDPNNSCTNFVTSNTTTLNGFVYQTENLPDLMLQEGVTYTLVVHPWFSDAATATIEFLPPAGGIVYPANAANPPAGGYAYTYAAVNIATDKIVAVSAIGDFTNLPGGRYKVYGLSYKSASPPPAIVDPASFVNQSVAQVMNGGLCANFSSNFMEVKVETCNIIGILVGVTSPCDAVTNTYSQQLKVIYELPPGSGSLVVNGQSFQITGSPQFVTLANLPATGQPVDVTAHFSADPGCQYTQAGLFTGAAADGKAGTAAVFDGGINDNDFISINGISVNTNTLTMMTWIKPSGTQPLYSGIIITDVEDENKNNKATGLNFLENNQLGVHWNNSQWWWESGLFVPEGEWSHVALVADGNSVRLYLNGVMAQVPGFSPGATKFTNVQLGTYRGWFGRNFEGQMDEVIFIGRALTTQEVRERMHLVEDVCNTELLGYYQFNGAGWIDGTGKTTLLPAGVSKAASMAPVARGTAVSKTVNAIGLVDFNTGADANLKINFATSPNGAVVVSHLTSDSPHGTMPGGANFSEGYWIVRNYGTTYAGLNATLTFEDGNLVTSDEANNYRLFRRASNATGAWDGPFTAAAASAAGGEVAFSGIGSFSQFIFRRTGCTPILDVDDNGIPNAGYHAGQTLNSRGIIDPNVNVNVTFKAGNSINLKAGFHAQMGANFRAFIEGCGAGQNAADLPVVHQVEEKSMAPDALSPTELTVIPNPFQGRADLRFALQETEAVWLAVYNTRGGLVRVLRNGSELPAGPHQQSFDATGLPAGIYYVQLKTGHTSLTRKIVLMK